MRKEKALTPLEAFEMVRRGLAAMAGVPEESDVATAMALAAEKGAHPLSELVEYGHGEMKLYIARGRCDGVAMTKTYK